MQSLIFYRLNEKSDKDNKLKDKPLKLNFPNKYFPYFSITICNFRYMKMGG